MFKSKSPFLVWFIFGILALVWGSSFILMKKGLEVYTSAEVGALRIALAGILMIPIAIKKRPQNLSKYILGFVIVGACGNLIPSFLFTEAETTISSSLAGMLNAFTPVFALLIGMLMFKTKPNAFQIFGLSLGFVGVILLLYKPDMEFGHIKGVAMAIFATLLYGISVNSVKKFLSDLEPLTAAAWAISLMSIIAWIYLLGFTNAVDKTLNAPGAYASLGFVAILGILGTAIATILFYELLKLKGSVFSTSVTYVIPIVAVFWGLIYHEKPSWWQETAMGIILIGVSLINKKKA
jgi:drug/metabolite transporter (DMT)-like permease